MHICFFRISAAQAVAYKTNSSIFCVFLLNLQQIMLLSQTNNYIYYNFNLFYLYQDKNNQKQKVYFPTNYLFSLK